MNALAHAQRVKWSRRMPGIVLASPAVILFIAMLVIPVGLAVRLSFTSWNGFSDHLGFVGFSNYRKLLSDPTVRSAMVVTGIIAIFGTVICNVLGLGLALLISKRSRSNTVLRTIFFYPAVVAALITGFLWSAILSTNGVINNFLSSHGASTLPFLAEPKWALASVIGVIIWSSFGFNLVLYVAGLQAVPVELMEAATMEGASPWQRLRNVTLPMIAPVITVNLVLVLVSLLRTYDLVVSLTAGGPAGHTQTVAYLILVDSFQNLALGFGSAQSVFLMVVTGIFAFILTISRRRAEAKVTN